MSKFNEAEVKKPLPLPRCITVKRTLASLPRSFKLAGGPDRIILPPYHPDYPNLCKQGDPLFYPQLGSAVCRSANQLYADAPLHFAGVSATTVNNPSTHPYLALAIRGLISVPQRLSSSSLLSSLRQTNTMVTLRSPTAPLANDKWKSALPVFCPVFSQCHPRNKFHPITKATKLPFSIRSIYQRASVAAHYSYTSIPIELLNNGVGLPLVNEFYPPEIQAQGALRKLTNGSYVFVVPPDILADYHELLVRNLVYFVILVKFMETGVVVDQVSEYYVSMRDQIVSMLRNQHSVPAIPVVMDIGCVRHKEEEEEGEIEFAPLDNDAFISFRSICGRVIVSGTSEMVVHLC